MADMVLPQLLWDLGTAYDLFISLEVLHNPSKFGVRGAWAAGVRARLPAAERETLELTHVVGFHPFEWIHALPEPKDGATVLWALGQVPVAERLPILTIGLSWSAIDEAELLMNVAARGRWDEKDREALRAVYQCKYEKKGKKFSDSPEKLDSILDCWSRSEEFGERCLEALRAYQESFFAEEEKRIRPMLQRAITRAQEMAQRLTLLDLLEELSQGVRFDELSEASKIILVPSYWSTPLIYYIPMSDERLMWVFGARPPDASLVPGELVPDALVKTLKALSDPTRLRILHYLAQEPLAPAELSRRLRLRAPTVTHHLKTLRLAGLVQLIIEGGTGLETKYYAARTDAVDAAFASLKGFIGKDKAENPG